MRLIQTKFLLLVCFHFLICISLKISQKEYFYQIYFISKSNRYLKWNLGIYAVLSSTAEPVGSACIGEHHNATNVSRIIATLWPIHKSLQNCITSIHDFRYIATSLLNNILINKLIIIYSLLCFFSVSFVKFFSYLLTMSRQRYMYRDTMRYINMSNLLVLLYKKLFYIFTMSYFIHYDVQMFSI